METAHIEVRKWRVDRNQVRFSAKKHVKSFGSLVHCGKEGGDLNFIDDEVFVNLFYFCQTNNLIYLLAIGF